MILAVDPGPVNSAYALIDDDCRPIDFGKLPNHRALTAITDIVDYRMTVAIEMVASYGMAVGADVFETCVWIGRFVERVERLTANEPRLVYRRDVKLHHCHDPRAKDANITQALIDRFAKGQPNRGKGTKANPGWFYGFHSDIWQAMALAVYVADTLNAEAA